MPTIPKCPACGSEVGEPGTLGLLMFYPEKKGYELSEGRPGGRLP